MLVFFQRKYLCPCQIEQIDFNNLPRGVVSVEKSREIWESTSGCFYPFGVMVNIPDNVPLELSEAISVVFDTENIEHVKMMVSMAEMFVEVCQEEKNETAL